MNTPDWQWNEMQQIGTDYGSLAEVEAYDKRMATFRDVDRENHEILEMFGLPKRAAILEIGCGTGRFSRLAAASGFNVTAVDISEIMLKYVGSKIAEEKLPPIQIRHCGFLTMDFPAASFDAVVSVAALHHLPDAWKMVALRKIAQALKSGGQLILGDVVFPVEEKEAPEEYFRRFVDSFKNEVRHGAIVHVQKEYSTYDWIMKGLLERAGFGILSARLRSECFMLYHCKKI